MLIEAGPRVLAGFADDLSAYAQAFAGKHRRRGDAGKARYRMQRRRRRFGDTRLEAKTIIWAAGVRASPAAEWLGAPADRAGRLQVEPDLTVPGHPDIFAIGDTVTITGLERAAGARHCTGRQARGALCRRRPSRRGLAAARPRRSATGMPAAWRRSASGSAVIDFGRIKLRGAIAWWIWGIAHIYFLIGMRHRLSVALSWLWIYVRDQRTRAADHAGQQQGDAVNFCLSMISAQTLCACREGKPVPTFPDHALFHQRAAAVGERPECMVGCYSRNQSVIVIGIFQLLRLLDLEQIHRMGHAAVLANGHVAE